MMGASRIPYVADLGNFTPAHRGHFLVQVHNELADLIWQSFAGFSRSPLFSRGEQALHSVAFKRIRFACQGAPGDIDFFGSLPCGFVK